MVINGLQAADVAAGRFAGEGYAFFRFPNAPEYGFVACQESPVELQGLTDIGRERGVVIAPFIPSATEPVLLIRPDVYSRFPAPAPFADGETVRSVIPIPFTDDSASRREAYSDSFAMCRKRLLDGTLRKVVLSRRLALRYEADCISPLTLFLNACRLHPRCYVSLWWTRRSGLWLTATPEVLLCADESEEGLWRTMALAGTMSWQGALPAVTDWSEKNRREQAYVSDYIRHRLAGLVAGSIEESTCRSVRAANMVHLRTDFGFRLLPGITLGAVIGRLHPTPAVCGEPHLAARHAIRVSEDTSRRYYAGFSGPVGLDGRTELYVSLRCMELTSGCALLYAGGGLLPDSSEEEEWEETCRKLRPMLALFGVEKG